LPTSEGTAGNVGRVVAETCSGQLTRAMAGTGLRVRGRGVTGEKKKLRIKQVSRNVTVWAGTEEPV